MMSGRTTDGSDGLLIFGAICGLVGFIGFVSPEFLNVISGISKIGVDKLFTLSIIAMPIGVISFIAGIMSKPKSN